MTHEQILTKAIEKAIAGGWQPYEPVQVLARTLTHTTVANYSAIYGLIFNHLFARALWGEDDLYTEFDSMDTKMSIAWRYHLMNMVIADDPIKYLGEHLD